MTVVVVATCFLPAFEGSPAGARGIVGIADRKLSTLEDSYEPIRGKHIAITKSIMGWYAGTPSEATEVLRYAAEASEPDASVATVAELTGRRLSEQRIRRARETIVRARGIPDEAPIPVELWGEVQSFTIGTDLIVAGVDATGAHVYRVNELGQWFCDDVYGFSAIGTGAALAISYMNGVAFSGAERLADAATAVYTAKRSAEASPMVGPALDLFILGPKSHIRYDPTFRQQLEDSYQHILTAQQDARAGSVYHIAAFLNRNPNGEGGLPYVLRYP